MRNQFVCLCRSFWADDAGSSPIGVGATLLAALACGIWFIVLIDSII
jgi:hypothetical protein